MTKFGVKWECPHCGTQQTNVFELATYGGNVLTVCDLEEGGCDKTVVVKVDVRVFTKAFKIEGLT